MAHFEILDEKHREIINDFKCSDEIEVEIFLKKDAYELQDHKCATTRLYFNDLGQFIGYFTLFNETVQIGKAKFEKYKWQRPSGLRYFPAVKIYYLGVDERFRGIGYGKDLLFEIFDLAVDLNELSGCAFITLEAKEKSIGFYTYHDFELHSREQYQNMIFNIKKLF